MCAWQLGNDKRHCLVFTVSIKSQLDSTGPVPHIAIHVEHSGTSFLRNF